MKHEALEYRAGENAVPGPYVPPPKITMQDVHRALAGTVTSTNANTPRALESIGHAITNRNLIEGRRDAGTPRPSDAADHLHYEREIYRLLRRLNLFATGAGA
jgi:hypothetical protein